MDFINRNSMTFPDTGTPRPASRASSTTTEVPGAPRSLARDVEHIKSLIARSNISSRGNEGSITATLFNWGSRTENVSQAHILQELDGLKKRIRIETKPVTRRSIEDDPETETETESEAEDDTLDEADEELDSIRAELQLVREQREQWIEAAEERIDNLEDERDALQEQLDACRRDVQHRTEAELALADLRASRDAVVAELASAQAKHANDLEAMQIESDEHQRQFAQEVLESSNQEIVELKLKLAAAEEEIAARRRTVPKEISELQSKMQFSHEQHAEQLTDMQDEHAKALVLLRQELEARAKQKEEASAQKHEETLAKHKDEVRVLQERHTSTLEELQADTKRRQESDAKELQDAMTQHQNKVADLQQSHASALEELETRRNQREAADAETKESIIAQHKAQMNDLQEKHTRSLDDLEAAAQQKEDSNTQERERLSTEHQTEIANLQQQLANVLAEHTTKSDTALREYKSQHDEVITKLRTNHNIAMQTLEDKSLREKQSLIADHEARMIQKTDEHEIAQRAARDEYKKVVAIRDEEMTVLKAQHAAIIVELQEQHASDLNKVRKDNETAKTQRTWSTNNEIAKLRASHTAELRRVQEERDIALKSSVDAEGQAQLMTELRQHHEEERAKWKAETAKYEEEAKQASARTAEEHNAALAELKAKHNADLAAKEERLNQSQLHHEKAILDTKERHAQELKVANQSAGERLAQASQTHAQHVAELEKTHSDFKDEAAALLDAASDANFAQCDEMREAHVVAVQKLNDYHEAESARLEQQRDNEVRQLKEKHISDLESCNRANLAALDKLQLENSQIVSRMQAELVKAQETLATAQHHCETDARRYEQQLLGLREELQAMQATSASSAKSLEERLRLEHQSQISNMRNEHESMVTQVDTEHQVALQRALDDANEKYNAADKHAATILQLRLDELTTSMRTKHDDDLKSVSDGHSKETAELRQQLLEAQADVERSRKDYASLSTLHASEVAQLFADHKAEINKLHEEHDGKISTLTDLLKTSSDDAVANKAAEASATEHENGEATTASDAAVPEQPTVIQVWDIENNESRQINRNTATATESAPAEPELSIAEHLQEELNDLRQQLSAMQKDHALLGTSQARLKRQNEIYQDQLSILDGNRSSPKSKYRSRGMQTSARIDVIGTPRSSHRRNISLPADVIGNGSPAQSKRSSLIFGPELISSITGSSLNGSHAHSVSRKDARPQTPTSPIISSFVNIDSPDTMSRRKTIKEFVQESGDNLFEPNSVATANEILLSRAIREHIGDVQKARDKLAKEYQSKFDALLLEKDRLDKLVVMENAAEFVRERDQVARDFMAQELNNSMAGTTTSARPSRQATEQMLVKKYQQRIAKRKSQIRLKHAEGFHDLTQDYDRRLGDLLLQKSEMDDIGYGQLELREDSDDTTRPARTPTASRLPRRSNSSLPRSITRMSSFTRDKEVLQVTKPRLDRTPSGEKGRLLDRTPTGDKQDSDGSGSGELRHPPVPQRSLLRSKSPAEGLLRQSIDDDTPLKPLASENPDSDYAGDQEEFEKQGKGLRRQSGTVQRVVSLRGDGRSPSYDGTKRHSNGPIYTKDKPT